MTDTFRALCAELLQAVEDDVIDVNDGRRFQAVVARARAALAQPEPQGPTDEELMAAYWEAFKNAAPCGADQSWLAGLRAVALWDRSVIEPDGPAVLGSREPASVTDQPTDEELDEFAIYWWGTEIDERSVSDVIESGSMAAFARAVLARWGRPAIEPVPVSERLPGPEDCDKEGCCWWWDYGQDSWSQGMPEYCINRHAHWLPHYALPVPGVEGEP